MRDGGPGGAVQPLALTLESVAATPVGSRRALALCEIANIQFDVIAGRGVLAAA